MRNRYEAGEDRLNGAVRSIPKKEGVAVHLLSQNAKKVKRWGTKSYRKTEKDRENEAETNLLY